MYVKEKVTDCIYCLEVIKHSKNNDVCVSVSSLMCFLNFLLNDCKCPYKHSSKLKKGSGKIEINVNCEQIFVVKEAFKFINFINNNNNN